MLVSDNLCNGVPAGIMIVHRPSGRTFFTSVYVLQVSAPGGSLARTSEWDGMSGVGVGLGRGVSVGSGVLVAVGGTVGSGVSLGMGVAVGSGAGSVGAAQPDRQARNRITPIRKSDFVYGFRLIVFSALLVGLVKKALRLCLWLSQAQGSVFLEYE